MKEKKPNISEEQFRKLADAGQLKINPEPTEVQLKLKRLPPDWIFPMQPAFLEADVFAEREAWRYQPKYDGWHVVIRPDGIFTRHGTDLTAWRCLHPLWEHLSTNPMVPLVGELLHVKGRSHIPSLKRDAWGGVIAIFDRMEEGVPLRERYAQLQEDAKGWDSNDAFLVPLRPLPDDTATAFAGMPYADHIEGVVFKKWESLYRMGRYAPVLSRDWQKYRFPKGED